MSALSYEVEPIYAIEHKRLRVIAERARDLDPEDVLSITQEVEGALGEPRALDPEQQNAIISLVHWIEVAEQDAANMKALARPFEERAEGYRASARRSEGHAKELRELLGRYVSKASAAGEDGRSKWRSSVDRNDSARITVSVYPGHKVAVVGNCSNPDHLGEAHFETEHCLDFRPDFDQIPEEFQKIERTPRKREIAKLLGDPLAEPTWAQRMETRTVRITRRGLKAEKVEEESA